MKKISIVFFLFAACFLCLVLSSSIVWSQNAPNKDSSTLSTPVKRLTCPLYFTQNGNFYTEFILEIDEANSLVNKRPAKFSENTISFEGAGFETKINRYSAKITVYDNNSPIAVGQCSKADERKF